jgi:hypothetical protein
VQFFNGYRFIQFNVAHLQSDENVFRFYPALRHFQVNITPGACACVLAAGGVRPARLPASPRRRRQWPRIASCDTRNNEVPATIADIQVSQP